MSQRTRNWRAQRWRSTVTTSRCRPYAKSLRSIPMTCRPGITWRFCPLSKGQNEQALQYLNQSLQLDPNQPSVYNQMGIIQMEMGNAVAARFSFNRALSLDPNYEPALQNLERLGNAQ